MAVEETKALDNAGGISAAPGGRAGPGPGEGVGRTREGVALLKIGRSCIFLC